MTRRKAAPVAQPPKREVVKITQTHLDLASVANDERPFAEFKKYVPLPGVIPAEKKETALAMDSTQYDVLNGLSIGSEYSGFRGYPQLAAMSQQVEYANMNSAPDSSLMISATASAELQNMTASPFSVNGAQKLTDVINSICSTAGYRATFHKMNGMTTSGSPYFEGSVFDQLHRICVDYGVAMSASPPENVDFWPTKNTRDEIIPLVSNEYGLVGYPIFSSGGIMFQTQYSSLLVIGRFIEMVTELPNASGKYQLSTVRHELSSWVPGGPWHSVCTAYRNNEARAEAQNKNE